MPDNFRPADLVAGLRNEDESGRDRLRRFCLLPIRRLVDRIMARHRSVGERGGMVELTLGRVEMDLRSRSSDCFEGMPTRTFLAMILAVAYRMLVPPEADGALVPLLAPDDEAALGRFAAGHATEEELNSPLRGRAHARRAARWIETVRDVLDARPVSADCPGPVSRGGVSRVDLPLSRPVERYLRLKLRDPNLADEVLQEFWTKLLDVQARRRRGPHKEPHRALPRTLPTASSSTISGGKLQPRLPASWATIRPPCGLRPSLCEAVIKRLWRRLEAYEVTPREPFRHRPSSCGGRHPRCVDRGARRRKGRQQNRSHATPEAFRKTLQGARAKFLRLLVQEVRETIHPAEPEEIEAEIFRLGFGHLFRRYGDFEGDDR